jgi:5-methylcytosine-specific restriction protein A
MELELGQEYKRVDIHYSLGEGNRQSGISRCKTSKQVLIFTSEKGELHGYKDYWEGDYFYYTGAGRVGDQNEEDMRHNGTVLYHKENGDVIRLMEETRSGHHKYIAELELIDFEYFQTIDDNDKNRIAVRFILRRTDSTQQRESAETTITRYKKPDSTSRRGLVTTRVGQGYYRQAILERFNKVCAVTGTGPEEILIASHIVPWRDSNDEERLDPDNGILLSPTYDLIGFRDDGSILVGETLSSEQQKKLGVSGHETIQVTDGMKNYLARHRAKLR